jgi:hypothetical protein
VTVRIAKRRNRLRPRAVVAGDGTGLEVGRTSHYFRSRRGDKRFAVPRWPKLTVCVDIASHLVVAAVVTLGPSRDTLEAPDLLRQACRHTSIRRILWDGGCDAESFHVVARIELGMHSVVPIKSGRKTRRWPKTKYRRQMKRRFLRRVYGQRWQVESFFSRHKRRLSSDLRATSWEGQQAETLLRVVVHNLMLLAV